MIFVSRSDTERSMIKARAMTEARSRNQMGQPAAWMMANNAFPYRFLDVLRGDCTAKARAAASCAVQQTGLPRHRFAARCSGYCDIHKNLWISLWIVDEQRLLTQLIERESRLRSKFEQPFPKHEQGVRQKNRLPRANLSCSGIVPVPMWIECRLAPRPRQHGRRLFLTARTPAEPGCHCLGIAAQRAREPRAPLPARLGERRNLQLFPGAVGT